MGYTTDFRGSFELDKPLTDAHKAYLDAFNQTRRMKRNAAKTAKLPDSLRITVGLPVGKNGEYFVGSSGDFGQEHTSDILDYNRPPDGQPGLWCQWRPTEDGTGIEWDEGEKFYHYVEWIEYIVKHFLKPWGYVLSGDVEWFGEDRDDIGLIKIVENVVTAKEGKVVCE